jgi:Uma2 family endonuclease
MRLGEVYASPFDVILSEINTFQPDLIFISQENIDIIQERGVFGTPDLVIEILSPSNPDHDRVKKFSIYEKFRLKELWIIDADKKSVEVFVLESDKLVSFCDARETMKIKSQTFTELDLCFDDLVKV